MTKLKLRKVYKLALGGANMDKSTIEEIIDNMKVWDLIKLIEVLQDKFGDEPDYKNVGNMKVKLDVDTEEFDEKIEQSKKKVDALVESTQEMGLGAFSSAELWEELADRGLVKITEES